MEDANPVGSVVGLSAKPDGRDGKSRITDTMRRWCLQNLGARLKALILTGSLARDEATWRNTDHGVYFLSDAEFMVIVADSAKVPSPEVVTLICSGVEEELRNQGIICKLSLGVLYESFLLDLGETIFGYELLTCGEVVYGDGGLLRDKARRVSQISHEDGWRILANRTVELLEIAPELVDGPEPLSEAAQYRLTKLYCDMASSLLVFKQEFVAGYQARATRLWELYAHGRLSGLPFDGEWFARMVRRCTGYKISHSWDGASPFSTWDSVQQAVSVLRSLWTWELAEMDGGTMSSPEAMLRRHMRRQKAKQRLRGWAFVVRRCGALDSLRHGGRWLRLACSASPRYCVYAAALETVSGFALQVSSTANSVQHGRLETRNSKLETALHWLPIANLPARTSPGEKAVAEAVLWNYREFLVETRA
jgi:hypothetical protein